MFEVRNVSAGYAGSSVLHDVDVALDAGEAVMILGPNGHGKTTLLRTISGLLRPTSGSIWLDGDEITDLPPDVIVERGIRHIPQGDLPFPRMTVHENLLMGAYRSEAWRRRHDALDRVFTLFPRLADRRTQLAQSLSGGERRMLALGRGIMAEARLLLIDEPSLGLAPQLASQVYEMIREIRTTGIAVLLVDESARHAADIVGRIYVLGSGRIVKEGSVQQILEDEVLLETYLG